MSFAEETFIVGEGAVGGEKVDVLFVDRRANTEEAWIATARIRTIAEHVYERAGDALSDIFSVIFMG
jgi:hypothetical protein